MELTRKKEISLKRVFLKFLMQIATSWILAFLLWVLLLYLVIASGFILPANSIENEVTDWLATRDDSVPFSLQEIPAGADYACFSDDGSLLWTNLSDSTLTVAANLAASSDLAGHSFSYPYAYRKQSSNTQTLILIYPIRASFASQALRHLFPSAEPFLLLLLLALLLFGLVFSVVNYAKKLETELSILEYTSEQIRARNLDFEVTPTHIVELNRILSSLLLLKTTLRQSLEQQWSSEQQKKRQMSALAHDIKTPLTVVKGNAELLSETVLSDEQQSYNAFILENTEQIQQYVTRMLEISRPATITDTFCNLPALLEQVARTAESLCAGKELHFQFVGESLPQEISLSTDSLKRALFNLIDNAISYSPSHGTVTLRAWQTDSGTVNPPMLCFCVEDDGAGFSAEALAHATDEFYRADSSRGSREHFGLGLSITRKLAAEQGGTLQLSNKPGGGACVTLSFPLIK